MRKEKTRTQRIFISDCEGPISLNDNAFELVTHFIPSGESFFVLISKYDDVLANFKPGYAAGRTLKLIAPFLKTYGATNKSIREYSARNILLVPGAKETLRFVKNTMPSFIISTSYEDYVSSLCRLVGFPYQNSFCTNLDLDRYQIDEKERRKLKEMRKEISTMPMIQIPKEARCMGDLSARDRMTIERLDQIWEEILRSRCGKMLEEIHPMDSNRKAETVKDIVRRQGSKLCNVMYVGDSITDVSAFRLVKENGGLTISFNGNEYAVRAAEIAVLSTHTIAISILADVFNRFGKERVLELVKGWGPSELKRTANPRLRERVLDLYPESFPKAKLITPANRKKLERETVAFRKSIRGETIGGLG